MESSGFSLHVRSCHPQTEVIYFFLSDWDTLISFSHPVAPARIPRTPLNRSAESGHLCLVLILEKFQLFTTECEVSCGLVVCGLYYVKLVSFSSKFVERFYEESILNFVKYLFHVHWDDRELFILGSVHFLHSSDWCFC